MRHSSQSPKISVDASGDGTDQGESRTPLGLRVPPDNSQISVDAFGGRHRPSGPTFYEQKFSISEKKKKELYLFRRGSVTPSYRQRQPAPPRAPLYRTSRRYKLPSQRPRPITPRSPLLLSDEPLPHTSFQSCDANYQARPLA